MAQPDPVIDSDEDEDDDDVKIVLLQPEEFDQPEGDGEEEEAHAEEGGEELLEAADEGEKVADGAAPSTPAGATPAKGSGKASDQRHKTWVDLDAVAPDNIDLDSVQDKAWRRPEADVSDYFNYGFTEETWRWYCKRQKELRQGGRAAGGAGRMSRCTPPSAGAIENLSRCSRVSTVLFVVCFHFAGQFRLYGSS
ncbi:hypothetical protein EMIHUDRAFT_198894 [Emiliania huxleyi CCMP1516]|uniref:Pre-mRNA polyadenylation factor Fip1 domain-containing protein n=2 Tax=Emiliania huxleyi TaxID=2903 RepID=A0A0D3I1Y5_EMIH1|nr:hypothetical protein EMIHUDRAFT_198894 [Emiliania huxleyi CCMP1516]EOD05270.1 hypothetical protein EMIHUDRAFT_198894 [Emiliania huxleyi CCMP1516]|eukprot:XP_005757699.1 hypothetical protein EMIHUDRAFT_198894 [Emiliania huxleyi CCMP1516]